ncbi:OsmC family peroxiredoxin [Conyzicola nivalis]|uniref:Osmotically inducible protein OsmC n=1 Tax=Conyzicola nivalis TaxID=1477021 RepID=A0A916SCA6_9MICO|nr:OsmC family peroxiredoxin [Conyzicola nivalis]GGA90897.1 osmotically inducible protein OsmC [Conyzicola nivalis]
MPTRSARTIWKGALQTGTGQVELTSSQLGTFDVSFPKRISETAGGSTSPEELIAAAHSACYSMALSGALASSGAVINELDISADVTLGPDPSDGQFKLTGIVLKVRADVSGVDADEFAEIALQAKSNCPVSKALAGVDIHLEATLVDA